MPIRCEIVEVRHSEDPVGTLCGKPAAQWCNDCGASLCEAHREPCDFCDQGLLLGMPRLPSARGPRQAAQQDEPHETFQTFCLNGQPPGLLAAHTIRAVATYTTTNIARITSTNFTGRD